MVSEVIGRQAEDVCQCVGYEGRNVFRSRQAAERFGAGAAAAEEIEEGAEEFVVGVVGEL